MFWRNIYTPSRIDTLLENENVTLQELMDEDDVVQECKSSNKKLLDFLSRPEIVQTLLKMVLDEASSEGSEKLCFKYSNIACELITSDVSQITDILVTTDTLVLSLLSFLDRPEPLNPLQASFFSKIMGLLISRKSEVMFDLVKSRDGFVESVLRHLGTSAIMDLLLRLMTCVDVVECRVKYIKWLNEEKLVQHLVKSISSSETPEKNTNAAQTLCDIIRLGKDTPSGLNEEPSLDVLLKEIEKSELLTTLLDRMFNGDNCESVIVNGLYVLQALLEPKRMNGMMQNEKNDLLSDVEHITAVENDLYKTLTLYVKEFHNLLMNPPKQHYTPMPSSLGPISQPVGLTRLQVASLITLLVTANNASINAELASLCTVEYLLNLFFQYPWNNFLHTQVEHCVTTVLSQNVAENPLLIQLVKEFGMLKKIMDAFGEKQDPEVQPGKQRLGHLGHLTRIANLIANKIAMDAESHLLAKLFKELPEENQQQWNAFVGGPLSEINHTNAIELGGSSNRGGRFPSSSEDDDDIGYLNFQMDDNLQKAFADYQTQQMTNNFVDQFGFSEDEISEQEESIGSPFMSKISSIDFELNMVEDNPTAAAMFEQACNDRIRQFDSNDSDEDSDIKEMLTFSHIPGLRHSSVIPDEDNRRSFNNGDSYEDEEDFAAEEMEDNAGSTDSEEDLSSPRLMWKASEGKDASIDTEAPSESTNNNMPPQTSADTPSSVEAINGDAPTPNTESGAFISNAVDSSHSGSLVFEVANGISIDAIDIHISNELSGCHLAGLTDHEPSDRGAANPDTNSS